MVRRIFTGVFVRKKKNCDGGNFVELMPLEFKDSNEICIPTTMHLPSAAVECKESKRTSSFEFEAKFIAANANFD